MAPLDKKKSEATKTPAKVETIGLKVFIHCEGCKKKVKKILQQIDGVETVHVDAGLGKVTVTGTADSKILLKKLEKAGKVAEVLVAPTTSGGKAKEQQKDQAKGGENKKEVKKVRFEDDIEVNKVGKGGGGNKAAAVVVEEGTKIASRNGANKSIDFSVGDASSGKSNRGTDGGFEDVSLSKNMVHKNITPRMVETGYSVESADYATHIFSDENTDSCHVM